jgi:uncharacterized protein YndB with AHSA1/START domain
MGAVATKSTFKRSVSVTADIGASPQTVWQLLTDAKGMPAWNSTVTSIDGEISLGQRLAIRVPISDRTFKPKVVDFEAPSTMTWADGQAPMFRGARVYRVEPRGDGTRFTMTETFSGLMLPMIARTLPDFVPVFDQYAADLKAAAERAQVEESS